jgi:uncharacterized membrane protein YbaN (DUF454 family)
MLWIGFICLSFQKRFCLPVASVSEKEEDDYINESGKVLPYRETVGVVSGSAVKRSSRLVRGGLVVAGTFSLGLGIIGIAIPILPTTPFLLLSAVCYSRSSDRFYNWLMGNRWFGRYIRNYREGRGMPARAKFFTVSLLWGSILFSGFVMTDIFVVSIILIVVAVAVTAHILSIKTLKE